MSSDFPLPAVASALQPYINPRPLTAHIRRTLTAHLAAQLSPQPISHLSLTVPPPSLDAPSPNIPTPGLYTEYITALRAQHAAQSHLSALRSSLADLTSTPSPAPAADLRPYISLLHRRRAHAKLAGITTALTTLLDTPPPDPAPTVPAPHPPIITETQPTSAHAADLTHTLKRSLLTTRTSLADAQSTLSAATTLNAATPSTKAQVLALRDARDALIAWVESELARIPEEGEEDGDVSILPADETAEPVPDNEAVSKRVAELYASYIAARQALLNTLAEVRVRSTRPVSPPPPTAAPAPAAARAPGPADLLPFLPPLLHAHRAAGALAESTSYLRRQLGVGREELAGTVQRLAGESYLLSPGEVGIGAWARAADESSVKMEGFVKEQIAGGRESVRVGKEAVRRMREVNGGVGGLRGEY
ncbi:hypothetical protein EJ06DRAFT_579816 [Trichodelitschia bisporula]|uniref:Uncharacterized protein n=1 Tax=Trichodelitschia bisporula TaxID=703511 RepID=A0A6G1I754_9PEZI|nr:hypothetical protein EJ06DRAFT_579816 [Trichodelitschia bisporula]